MRGQVLKVREYDFVQAARALGASDRRILFTHILPNAVQPLIVQASLGMAGAVLSEASLSFLGLGIPPPAPSWGTMIEEGRGLDTLYAAPHVYRRWAARISRPETKKKIKKNRLKEQ
jgi:peptide/nickel transport system permease protein